jgi:hypothetical protein
MRCMLCIIWDRAWTGRRNPFFRKESAGSSPTPGTTKSIQIGLETLARAGSILQDSSTQSAFGDSTRLRSTSMVRALMPPVLGDGPASGPDFRENKRIRSLAARRGHGGKRRRHRLWLGHRLRKLGGKRRFTLLDQVRQGRGRRARQLRGLNLPNLSELAS